MMRRAAVAYLIGFALALLALFEIGLFQAGGWYAVGITNGTFLAVALAAVALFTVVEDR